MEVVSCSFCSDEQNKESHRSRQSSNRLVETSVSLLSSLLLWKSSHQKQVVEVYRDCSSKKLSIIKGNTEQTLKPHLDTGAETENWGMLLTGLLSVSRLSAFLNTAWDHLPRCMGRVFLYHSLIKKVFHRHSHKANLSRRNRDFFSLDVSVDRKTKQNKKTNQHH